MFNSAISTQTSVHVSPTVSGGADGSVGVATPISSTTVRALYDSSVATNIGTTQSFSEFTLSGITCAGAKPTTIKQLFRLCPNFSGAGRKQPITDNSRNVTGNSGNTGKRQPLSGNSINALFGYTEQDLEELRADREYYEALCDARVQLLEGLRSKLREFAKERAKKNGFICKISSSRQSRRANKDGDAISIRRGDSEDSEQDEENPRDAIACDGPWRAATGSVNSSTHPSPSVAAQVPMHVDVAATSTTASPISTATASAPRKSVYIPHAIRHSGFTACASPLSGEEEGARGMSQSQDKSLATEI